MINFTPKDLPLIAYITSEESINLDANGNIVTLSDLTSNGNDFDVTGTPTIEPNGINGIQSIRFNGTNGIKRQSTLNGLTDLSKRTSFIVFKITEANGISYHNICLLGAKSYTVAGNFIEQVYKNNNTNTFIHNLFVNTLDGNVTSPQFDDSFAIMTKTPTNAKLEVNNITITKNGVQNVANQGIYIGNWNSKGAKMLFCEFGICEELTAEQQQNLKLYFREKYGLIVYNKPVIQAGVNGNNTADVIARLTSINSHKAKTGFLMIGMNDWRSPVASKRRSVSVYKQNLRTIVQSMKANGTNVVLLTPTPILNSEQGVSVCSIFGLPSNCDADATGQPYRQTVAEIATEENCLLLDLYQEFVNIGQPTNLADSFIRCMASAGIADGVHYSELGTSFVAQKIYDFIIINGLDDSSNICVGDSLVAADGLPALSAFPIKLRLLINP